MPTAKLDVCDIKFVTAYPDKIKSKTLNREQISIERTFLKKSSAKNFLAESFWEFSKIVRSTVVSNCRAFFYFNYAIGVCGNNFNTTMPEFSCRHCRPSLRQQIYNASVVERLDSMKGYLREVAKRRYGSE